MSQPWAQGARKVRIVNSGGLIPPRDESGDEALGGIRRDVGAEVRRLRKRRGMSGRALATTVGITPGYVSQMEQGQVMPSVAILLKVCSVFDVGMGDLFDPRRRSRSLIKARERPSYRYPDHSFIDEHLSADVKGKLQVLASTIMPGGGSGEELYAHGADTEFVLVLKGALTLRLAGEVYNLDEGDAMTFSGDIPHGYINQTNQPCEVIWVITPASY